MGTLKGVGRVYQQTYVDTYSKVAHAKLYTTKTPITAADILNDHVLPFYVEQQLPILRILTDRGTEYCGNRERHDYQLYLAINDIDHTKTKVKSPQTNGICGTPGKPGWISWCNSNPDKSSRSSGTACCAVWGNPYSEVYTRRM